MRELDEASSRQNSNGILKELMTRWRATRDQGMTLSQAEQAELKALVETELKASAARAQGIAEAPGR